MSLSGLVFTIRPRALLPRALVLIKASFPPASILDGLTNFSHSKYVQRPYLKVVYYQDAINLNDQMLALF
jgi:hypothetical protein